MRIRTLTGLTLAGATLLAACGGSGGGSPTAGAVTGGHARAHPAAATINVRSTQLGDVLVDAQGRTLYGFTDDANGTPTCSGACAKAWPAEKASDTPVAGDGIDGKLLTTVDGTDGGQQLKVGKWPVYTFAGDAAPGDTNGQGSANKWFVIGADGKLIK